MSRRQSNVQGVPLPKQPTNSTKHDQIHASTHRTNQQTDAVRKHRSKTRQCNISPFRQSAHLFSHDAYLKDDTKLNSLFMRQSNVTCRSSLSDSIYTTKDAALKEQDQGFGGLVGLVPTSSISTRARSSTTTSDEQEGGILEDDGRKKQVLQAVENVGFVEEEEDYFGHLHQQNGSSAAEVSEKRKFHHQSDVVNSVNGMVSIVCLFV